MFLLLGTLGHLYYFVINDTSMPAYIPAYSAGASAAMDTTGQDVLIDLVLRTEVSWRRQYCHLEEAWSQGPMSMETPFPGCPNPPKPEGDTNAAQKKNGDWRNKTAKAEQGWTLLKPQSPLQMPSAAQTPLPAQPTRLPNRNYWVLTLCFFCLLMIFLSMLSNIPSLGVSHLIPVLCLTSLPVSFLGKYTQAPSVRYYFRKGEGGTRAPPIG